MLRTLYGLDGMSVCGDNQQRVVVNGELDWAVEKTVADDSETISLVLLLRKQITTCIINFIDFSSKSHPCFVIYTSKKIHR